MKYDAAESARLVAYVRDRQENQTAGPTMRDLAEQLEAAGREIETWQGRARAALTSCTITNQEARTARGERDAARAGIAKVFELIASGDLELVHWSEMRPDQDVEGFLASGHCPEDDTCTCRIRRAMLELQLAGGDVDAQALLDKLPPDKLPAPPRKP